MFYSITTKLRELLKADINVNTVTYGELDENALDKHTTYPLAHFNISNVTRGKANTYDIQLLLMDILDQSKELDRDFIRNNNLHDVLNTQELVGMRLLELLERGDLRTEGFVLSGSPTFTPFIERFKNDVAGWEVTFQVQMPNDMDICGIDDTPEQTFNTLIGGGAINHPTKTDIANAIGILETEIEDFTVDGDDLKFNVLNPYQIQASAFIGDLDITSYMDYDGLVTSVGASAFFNCRELEVISMLSVVTLGQSSFRATHLKRASFPLATSIGNFCFRECFVLNDINIPSIVGQIGVSPSINNVFLNCRNGMTLTTSIAMSTNNGGLPDGDVQYVTDTLNGTVIYV